MVAAGYIAAILLAEVLTATVDPRLGAVVFAGLLLVLPNQVAANKRRSSQALIPVLMVVAVAQLLDVAMPLSNLSIGARCALVGAPTLIAAGFAVRAMGGSLRSLRPNAWRPQLAIAAGGVPLSALTYVVLAPGRPQLGSFAAEAAAAAALILFSALTEELVYRVLFMDAAAAIFGRYSLWIGGVLFAGAYLGTRSVGFVILAGVIGVGFASCYRRTGSILGPVLAHSVINVGTFLVWPHVWVR